MTQDEAEKYLRTLLGWTLISGGKEIRKTYLFSDFSSALSFVNAVGDISENEGHHPDILLYAYKKVDITISTHAIGGLSENDFILATKIDATNPASSAD